MIHLIPISKIAKLCGLNNTPPELLNEFEYDSFCKNILWPECFLGFARILFNVGIHYHTHLQFGSQEAHNNEKELEKNIKVENNIKILLDLLQNNDNSISYLFKKRGESKKTQIELVNNSNKEFMQNAIISSLRKDICDIINEEAGKVIFNESDLDISKLTRLQENYKQLSSDLWNKSKIETLNINRVINNIVVQSLADLCRVEEYLCFDNIRSIDECKMKNEYYYFIYDYMKFFHLIDTAACINSNENKKSLIRPLFKEFPGKTLYPILVNDINNRRYLLKSELDKVKPYYTLSLNVKR